MAQLNEIHVAQLSRFGSFLKGKRDRALMDRESDKEDFKSDHLMDDAAIFNCQDVAALLEAYHTQVMARQREDLEATANLSAVFASHLMGQAEDHGMALQVEDISVIEDHGQLQVMASLAAMNAPPLAPRPRATLAAMGTVSSDPAVLQELADVREENRVMQDRQHQMMTEISQVKSERSTLAAELEQVKANFKQHIAMKHEGGEASGAQLAEYQRLLDETQQQLEAKHYELETLRRDMEQRLGDSNQFIQLKAIVKRKSEEIKALKGTLVAHGLMAPDGDDCVELEADSD